MEKKKKFEHFVDDDFDYDYLPEDPQEDSDSSYPTNLSRSTYAADDEFEGDFWG